MCNNIFWINIFHPDCNPPPLQPAVMVDNQRKLMYIKAASDPPARPNFDAK